MGTSPNLCIQLNINLVKCRLKIPVSVTGCMDSPVANFACFVHVAAYARETDFAHLLFSCWFGNSLFDEIFRSKKLHALRNNDNEQQCKRLATAGQFPYILTVCAEVVSWNNMRMTYLMHHLLENCTICITVEMGKTFFFSSYTLN